MAEQAPLAGYHIQELAKIIPLDTMKTIAEGKLGFTNVEIDHCWSNTKHAQTFNADIIRKWAHKNRGIDQVKVSMLGA